MKTSKTPQNAHRRRQKSANFRFYEELNDFLPKRRRKIAFEVGFFGSPGVKDIIESLGVPHAEIDLILANGRSVDFSYRLSDRDRISVYPVFESLDISPLIHLRPHPLRHPAFICDVHLGTLARRLRLLGFDTLYRNDYDDLEIAVIARNEHRCILTRDTGLLKIGIVTRGYRVRSTTPREQLDEVVARLQLKRLIAPFTRCLACNGPIVAVEKETIAARLEEKTARYYDTFFE
jgi:hypothetical protein